MCVGCLNSLLTHPLPRATPHFRANVLYYCCLLLFCTGKRKFPIWLPYAYGMFTYAYTHSYTPCILCCVAHCHHYECAKKFTVDDLLKIQIGPSVMGAVPGKVSSALLCPCVCVQCMATIHHARTHAHTHRQIRCDAPLKIQVTATAAAGDKVRPVRALRMQMSKASGAAAWLGLAGANERNGTVMAAFNTILAIVEKFSPSGKTMQAEMRTAATAAAAAAETCST